MFLSNLYELCEYGATHYGRATAIRYKDESISYVDLNDQVNRVAAALTSFIKPGDRVAIYLPKCLETVIASFAITRAGGILIPINPVLKAAQVEHILADSSAALLISQGARLKGLATHLAELRGLQYLVSIDSGDQLLGAPIITWAELARHPIAPAIASERDSLCAILYTSGSTGLPKGVMLSHYNLLLGTASVAEYLALSAQDKILAVLPFSFDYGFNQLLSSMLVGAECVLLDYLLPRDIPNACVRYGITGLAAVPPLWLQLSDIAWPEAATKHLRYFTNSGGHLSTPLLASLRDTFPKSLAYLMYGLTEAFRSTYLPPNLVDAKPGSMGKPIPYADIYVLNEEGELCADGEEGELVHAGALVAKGYWRRPEATKACFKALAKPLDDKQSLAVWSGDQVVRDVDGFLYYKGRKDEQIKASGYRISPEEVETSMKGIATVKDVLVFGTPDERRGQVITAVLVPDNVETFDETGFRLACRKLLPAYMLPTHIIVQASFPKNPNGKLDRATVLSQLL